MYGSSYLQTFTNVMS